MGRWERLLRTGLTAECSGAKDALVPGEYAEILAVHADDASPVLAEIEKDVSRTFPGNVFFGGDGVGVAKLRRVLIAFSWFVRSLPPLTIEGIILLSAIVRVSRMYC